MTFLALAPTSPLIDLAGLQLTEEGPYSHGLGPVERCEGDGGGGTAAVPQRGRDLAQVVSGYGSDTPPFAHCVVEPGLYEQTKLIL